MAKTLIIDSFSPKRVDEDWVIGFNFVGRLASGETISTATCTATVFAGTDASPSSIISGSTTTTGTKVTQLIVDGVDGVTYQVQCAITTSSSQKRHIVGLLDVTNEVKRR